MILNIFLVLFSICISWAASTFELIDHIFNWVVCLLNIEFSKFFIYFRFKCFISCVTWKYFLPISDLSFHSLNCALQRGKVFSFYKVQLINFSNMDCTFGDLRNLYLAQDHKDLLWFLLENL